MHRKDIIKAKYLFFKYLWKSTYTVIKYRWKIKYKFIKFYRLFKYYFIEFSLLARYYYIWYNIIHYKIIYKRILRRRRSARRALIKELRYKNMKKNITPKYEKFCEGTINNIKTMYYLLMTFLIRQGEAICEKGWTGIITLLLNLKQPLIFYFLLLKYLIIKVSVKYKIIRLLIRVYLEYISVKRDINTLATYIIIFIEFCFLEIKILVFLKKNKEYVYIIFTIIIKLLIYGFIIFYPILITIVLDYTMFLEFIPMSEPNPWFFSYVTNLDLIIDGKKI